MSYQVPNSVVRGNIEFTFYICTMNNAVQPQHYSETQIT